MYSNVGDNYHEMARVLHASAFILIQVICILKFVLGGGGVESLLATVPMIHVATNAMKIMA